MTHLLSSLANGKIILALEGGYNLTSIAYSMSLCTKALLGDPIPPLSLNKEINPDALCSIQNVLDVHSQYWSVLKPFRTYLPRQENLIPLGNYSDGIEAVTAKMADMELKNNNFKHNNKVPSSVNSKSAISPERANVNASSTPQSPEAITMTLVVGNQSLTDEDTGACGGISLETARGRASKNSVILSNMVWNL